VRFVRSYKTQFIGTHLFHGPISHVFIYSGWLLVMLLLSIIDMYFRFSIPTSLPSIILFSGSLIGLFYALAQIYNGTFAYQFVTGTFAGLVFTVFALINRINLVFAPIALYFFAFLLTFELVIFCYLFLVLALKKDLSMTFSKLRQAVFLQFHIDSTKDKNS